MHCPILKLNVHKIKLLFFDSTKNNSNVYLNKLLSKLRENGLGCHMNGQCVGTFIYADDITILAPSHSSLQSMLTICDQYVSRHHMIFNPTKTKCMFFPTNKNMKHCPFIFKNH